MQNQSPIVKVGAAQSLRRHKRCRRKMRKLARAEVATEAQEEGQGLEGEGSAQKYTDHCEQSKDRQWLACARWFDFGPPP